MLAITDMVLRPNQVVKLYQRCWQIEGYFKTAKQYLRLTKTRMQDYDALCGHTALVMITYDFLVWQRRLKMNKKTLGDMFYKIKDAIPNMTVFNAVRGLARALAPLCHQYGIPQESFDNTVDQYLVELPRELEKYPNLNGYS